MAFSAPAGGLPPSAWSPHGNDGSLTGSPIRALSPADVVEQDEEEEEEERETDRNADADGGNVTTETTADGDDGDDEQYELIDDQKLASSPGSEVRGRMRSKDKVKCEQTTAEASTATTVGQGQCSTCDHCGIVV